MVCAHCLVTPSLETDETFKTAFIAAHLNARVILVRRGCYPLGIKPKSSAYQPNGLTAGPNRLKQTKQIFSSMLLSVHTDNKDYWGQEPRTATSTFTQLLSSDTNKAVLLLLLLLLMAHCPQLSCRLIKDKSSYRPPSPPPPYPLPPPPLLPVPNKPYGFCGR